MLTKEVERQLVLMEVNVMCTSLPEQNLHVMRCPCHQDVMRMWWLRNPEDVMKSLPVLVVNVMRNSHLQKVDVMEPYVMESPSVTGVLRMIYGPVKEAINVI